MGRTKEILEDWHKPLRETLQELNITAVKLAKDTGIQLQSINSVIRHECLPTLSVILQCRLTQYIAKKEKDRVESILAKKGILASVTVEVLRDIYTVRVWSKDFEIFRDCLSGKYITVAKKSNALVNDINL